MGATPSILKRKNVVAVKAPQIEAEGCQEVADGPRLEQAANDRDLEGISKAVAPTIENENTEDLEGVEDTLCRLAQAHPTQTSDRWELIAEKLNRSIKKKNLQAQSLRALLSTEDHVVMLRSWGTEVGQLELANHEQRNKAGAQKRRASDTSLRGTKDSPKSNDQARKEQGSNGVEGESDTEPESDMEQNAGTVQDQTVPRSPSTKAVRSSDRILTKYEVFALMRRLHERLGPMMVQDGRAVEDMRQAEAVVDRLFDHLPAASVKAISQQNRLNARLDSAPLAYGEISIGCFLKVLVKLKRVHGHMMTPGGSFWDLGGGVGKLVIAAAMMHDFESCYGVEVMEDLRDASRPILKKWRKEEVQELRADKADIRVDFMFADVMKQGGWVEEATLLYINTNLSAVNMRELRKRAGCMQVGAICLSVSVPAVDDDKWGLLGTEEVDTSWGKTMLYIHEKLAA